MLTRYEELTRKCYGLIRAAATCYKAQNWRMGWIWQDKALALFEIRDAMTVGEGMEPADSEMGSYALP